MLSEVTIIPSNMYSFILLPHTLQHDDQCEGHLKCYQRDGGEEVPGCSGGRDSPSSKYNYNVKRSETLNLK